MTDLESAKMQFKIALDIINEDYLVKIDSQCLSALLKVIRVSNKNIKREDKDKAIAESIEIVN